MKKYKIIIALVLWVSYINLYNIYILPSNIISDSNVISEETQRIVGNINNWLLGIIATFSVVAIICGGAGYIFCRYKKYKEKEQIFKIMIKYGSIVLFFVAISYSLTTAVIVERF